jgi:hypothetical protein
MKRDKNTEFFDLTKLTDKDLIQLENAILAEKGQREAAYDRKLAADVVEALEKFVEHVDYPNIPCLAEDVVGFTEAGHCIKLSVDGLNPVIVNAIINSLSLFANGTI